MKKAVLGLFSFCALCGLAYYSTYLYSDRYQQDQNFGTELEAEQQPAGEEAGNRKEPETSGENKEDALGDQETSFGQGKPSGSGDPKDPQGIDSLETKAGEQADMGGAEEETDHSLLETGLPADAVQAETEYTYYLIEEFGYVNIYNADQETIYEYTEISIGDLPEELQQEICTGKGVVTEQELYDFLENYSS